MMNKKERKTLLISDKSNPITEIICQAVFPYLKILDSNDEGLQQTLAKKEFDSVILDTKSREVSTSVLLIHEKNNVDVIPYEFVDLDTSQLKSSTLSKLIFFELYRLRSKSLRQKVNLFSKTSLGNISDQFENENSIQKGVQIYPTMFYNLIKSINREDSDCFILFCRELNKLIPTPDSTYVAGVVNYLKQSQTEIEVARIFTKSIDSFFENSSFEKVNEPILDFINRLVRCLETKMFKIKLFDYNTLLMFCAFDKRGKYNLPQYIQDLTSEVSSRSNQIIQQTFSQIFSNDNYRLPAFSFDSKNASNWERCFYESSKTFLDILAKRKNITQNERFFLAKGLGLHAKFLITQPDEEKKKKFLEKYLGSE